jgi:AraC-like DNA-binding protein
MLDKHAMDVLSDVLRVVRLSGAVFFNAEFSSPWAITSPQREELACMILPTAECVSLFHVVVDGECWCRCTDHPEVHLTAGDIVVLPHSHPHDMSSHKLGPQKGAEPTPVGEIMPQGTSDALPTVRHGGGGKKSRFVCGYLQCDQRFSPLIGSLPTMMVLRRSDRYTSVETVKTDGLRRSPIGQSTDTWLSTTLNYMINEASSSAPGNATMLERLTELVFVEILRQYMKQLPEGQSGWLSGLNDPYVGTALRLMHEDPARNWTVEDLARETAISRSALAQKFSDMIGDSPMHYLAVWRVELAKQMLRGGRRGIPEIADSVGYESEAAFNRAFKRLTGSPPATWRKVKTVASEAERFGPRTNKLNKNSSSSAVEGSVSRI